MKNGNQIKWIKIGAFIFWQCSVISNMPRRRNIKFLLSEPDIPSIWLQFRQYFLLISFMIPTAVDWILDITINISPVSRQLFLLKFHQKCLLWKTSHIFRFECFSFLRKFVLQVLQTKRWHAVEVSKKSRKKKKEMKFQKIYDIRKVFGFFCNKTVYVST